MFIRVFEHVCCGIRAFSTCTHSFINLNLFFFWLLFSLVCTSACSSTFVFYSLYTLYLNTSSESWSYFFTRLHFVLRKLSVQKTSSTTPLVLVPHHVSFLEKRSSVRSALLIKIYWKNHWLSWWLTFTVNELKWAESWSSDQLMWIWTLLC